MRHATFILGVVSAFNLAACGPGDDPVAPKDFEVAVWVQDDGDLLPEDVMQGCMAWSAVGVTCWLVEREQEGEVRIYAHHPATCEWTGEGYTLGWATYGGEVSISITCLKATGLYYRDILLEVVTHEIGHHLGIWNHVPVVCDGTEQVHPGGEHVCGLAIMNSDYHLGVDTLTRIDELAFDMRSRGSSIIGDAPQEINDDIPKCVYLKRP